MKVMKFGGSSVQDAEHIKRVVGIIKQEAEKEQVFTVFSAMKGITDTLIASAESASTGDSRYKSFYETIVERQRQATTELISESSRIPEIEVMLGNLKDVLHGIELVKECSQRTMDLVMSFGERLNCTLITAYMKSIGIKSRYIDSRNIIETDDVHTMAAVDFEVTNNKVSAAFEAFRENEIAVITGFIASSPKGATTTLGRNGSDYTASIIGGAVGATRIEIWTDVDGVLSADPRYVKDAYVVPEISVQEAMELSYFGAEVIHPKTMLPAVEKQIPIIIRNTLNPAAPGSIIAGTKPPKRPDSHDITGIASIENAALINVEGGGMIGIPGVAGRVFTALAEAGVNVVMISQASSEHSICLVCRQKEAKQAENALRKELGRELNTHLIDDIDVQTGMEIVAVVGDNMKGKPGISGRLFQALGEAKVNVQAIAQGSSERNISFVVKSSQREVALNVVHAAFLKR